MKTNPVIDLQSSIAPERRDIERCLGGLSQVPKDQILDRVNELNQRISSLHNHVKEQIAVQPSSVIRVCTWEVKSLADQLNLLRAQLVPKPKFRFRSRAMLTSGASSSTRSSDSSSPSLLAIADADSSMVVDDPRTPLIFNGQTGAHLSIDSYLSTSEISPPSSPLRSVRDINLTQLTECTINLIPRSISLGNVYVKNLKRCLIVVPPITGNILLHDCVGSTLIGACHQLQVHNSTAIDLYVTTTEDPVIDGDSSSVRVHPYPQEETLNGEQLQLLFDGKDNSISPAPIVLTATHESDLN